MKQEEPLVSIIIALYNNERYLDQCIKSIVEQTYRNLEIIVVDDGSNDSSGKIADSWSAKDTRIKVIHKKNGGVSSAKNAGLDAAHGELIGFVDSDDYIAPDMYAEMVKAMNGGACDVVRCGMERVNPEGKSIERVSLKEKVYTREECFGLLDNGLFVMNPLSLNKRKVYEKVRFPEKRVNEDTAIAHLIIDNSDGVHMLDICPYKYRIQDKSIMHGKPSLRKLDIIEAIYERFLFFEEKGYRKFLNSTCISAKNSLGLINLIEIKTPEEKKRKQEMIKMFKYMYKNSDGRKPLQCFVCYYFPELYLFLNKISHGRRNSE